ncbi:hypothetical protein ACCE85_001937 [Photobacterium damselae]
MSYCSTKLIGWLVFSSSLVAWDCSAMICQPELSEVAVVDACNVSPSSPSLFRYASPWRLDTLDRGKIFWNHWDKLNVETPVFTEYQASTFYGLGFWVPEKYEYQPADADDPEDWIRQHGLQMSFGMTGSDPNSPRFRFDYRWHEREESGLSMHVQIPFQ